jgi:DNA ligase-1
MASKGLLVNDLQTVIASLGASDMGAPVFKRASSGAIQTWRVERDGEKFRTHHGQVNGKIQVSEWTVCEGKNIGKANETSPANQAIAEVIALYKKKVTQGKYFYTLEDIDEVTYISPMLAEKFDPKRLEGEEYFAVQPKLDGVRCIINAKGMWSRKGKPFPAVMHIHEQLKPLFVMNPNLVLDGELYNHKYHAEFEELISVIKQQKPTEEDLQKSREIVEFHCYDIPTVPETPALICGRIATASLSWCRLNGLLKPSLSIQLLKGS